MLKFALCVIALLGVLGSEVMGSQHISPYQDQWNKMMALINALNRLYAENGFPTRAFAPVNSNPSPIFYRRVNRCQAWAFGDTNSFGIDFRQNSDEVLDFFNWPAINSIEGPDAPLHAIKPVPTWSEDRVAKLAQACAFIFFPDMAKTARVDFTYFSTDLKSGSAYYDGHWTVILRRISTEGYPFRSDFINVDIGERTGPLSAVMRIPSNFSERQYHPISKEEASLSAAKGLDLFRKSRFSSWVQGPSTTAKMVEPPKLEVVNPYDTNATSLEDYAHSQGVNATLAWVTGYQLETPEPADVGPRGATQKYTVYIFVGAEDGRFLGADF
ncbi:MAG: hypothetical protein LV481_00445 [Methylacidiphilales bacterium]|nr:hypothetical protein [Candidatus Methylacidiphilales bacterium]